MSVRSNHMRPRAGTAVERQRIPRKGYGLVATRRIERGEIVVSMVKPIAASYAEWSAKMRRRRLRHDAVIEMQYSRRVVYDDSFMCMNKPPKWYMLNHSKDPNTRMVRHGGGISWIATRVIQKKEELTFRYKNPNREWE